MNKQTLVFEIGVEEIPSQYVATMADSLRENAIKMLTELRLDYKVAEVFYTPRRFSLIVSELAERQTNSTFTTKGPAKRIAFDADGNPTNALKGFLRKVQRTIDDVYFVADEKAEYVAVDVTHEGKDVCEVLQGALSDLIFQIYNPNPMHWGNYAIKFVRPIRWLLALYGDRIINVEIECAKASNLSYGHRTLKNCAIAISSAENYLNELADAFVIVNPKMRRDIIVSQIKEIELHYNFSVEIDEALLREVINIVEYPTCAVGKFDEKYLALPECIIKDPLKTQQRYFPVYKNGHLVNYFVYTRNGGDYYIDNVTRGNERVLRPRLEDAEFFYNNDLKTSLEEKADSLKNIMFVDNGGSYWDKSKRIEAISLRLARQTGFNENDLIIKTAHILKADLTSSVVREYTDTQGLVGGVFAAKEGYDKQICTAISEQYLPNFYGDKLPSEMLSSIISIADKLDTVMCLCAVGLKPIGSSDPYALRRQTLGIFNIALNSEIDLDFDKFIDECSDLYIDKITAQGESVEEYVSFVKNYFYQRLRVFLHDEKSFAYEDLDKISVTDLNVCKSVKKATMIENIRSEQWYLEFLQIFNRILKLIKSSTETHGNFDSTVVDQAAEGMFTEFYSRKNEIINFIDSEEYEKAIQIISETGKTINEFMENNMALCKDDIIRHNRLAFFVEFTNICSNIIHI